MSNIKNQPIAQINAAKQVNAAKQWSGRKIFLLLALVFVLPFTIAATLHLLNLHPKGKSYGDLITPPKPVSNTTMLNVDGKPFKHGQWLKKWSLVYVDAAGCPKYCQDQAHTLKQLHVSLGKERDRIQRIMIVQTNQNENNYATLQNQYPDLLILQAGDDKASSVANDFLAAHAVSNQSTANLSTTAKQSATSNAIWLVDPLGNIMMTYDKNQNPKGIQTDIKRLLKNSWAG